MRDNQQRSPARMKMIGSVLSPIAVLLLGVSAHAAVRLCGFSLRAERLAACLLVAAAELVLLAELLSLMHGFRLGWGLAALALWCAASVWISHRRRAYVRKDFSEISAWCGAAWRSIEPSRFAVLSAALLALILAGEFALAVLVAPNGFDALAYHLTRAAMWLQRHSIEQYPLATERQAAFPINGEVIQAWALMFARGDRTVQLVQWSAGVGSLAIVFAFTRRLGHPPRDAVMATALAASLPLVVAQSSSAQNDLIFALFALAVLLFGAIWIRDENRAGAVLAAVAFGLAVGTKSVALPTVAAFGAFALALCWPAWRRLALPAALAVAAVLILGTFNYAQNLEHHHSLTAAPSQDELRIHSAGEIPANSVRSAWGATVNTPGIIVGPLNSAVTTVASPLLGWAETGGSDLTSFSLDVRSDTREDRSGYGPLALLVLLPAVLMALARPGRRERFALAVYAVAAFVVIAVTLRFNVWISRFYLSGFLAAVPLAAVFFRREWARGAIFVLMVVSALPILFFNDYKSVAQPSVVAASRPVQLAAGMGGKLDYLTDIAESLPDGGRVGVIGTADALEFELFGSRLQNHVVLLAPADLKPGVMRRFDLDALVVLDTKLAARAKQMGGRTLKGTGPDGALATPLVLMLKENRQAGRPRPARSSR